MEIIIKFGRGASQMFDLKHEHSILSLIDLDNEDCLRDRGSVVHSPNYPNLFTLFFQGLPKRGFDIELDYLGLCH